MKWQLPDGQGGYVSSLSNVSSLQIAVNTNCSGDVEGEPTDLGTAGNADLHQDVKRTSTSNNLSNMLGTYKKGWARRPSQSSPKSAAQNW